MPAGALPLVVGELTGSHGAFLGRFAEFFGRLGGRLLETDSSLAGGFAQLLGLQGGGGLEFLGRLEGVGFRGLKVVRGLGSGHGWNGFFVHGEFLSNPSGAAPCRPGLAKSDVVISSVEMQGSISGISRNPQTLSCSGAGSANPATRACSKS